MRYKCTFVRVYFNAARSVDCFCDVGKYCACSERRNRDNVVLENYTLCARIMHSLTSIMFSRVSCRVPGRRGGRARVPEEDTALPRVTYHYVTSLEFRIRRAHLDADTGAVKEPQRRRKREVAREGREERPPLGAKGRSGKRRDKRGTREGEEPAAERRTARKGGERRGWMKMKEAEDETVR